MNPTPTSAAPVLAAFVGLDWGNDQHLVALRAADATAWQLQELPHTPEALTTWATGLRQQFGGRPVGLCLEQSRGPVAYALSAFPWLVLYPINPKTLARYREAVYPSGAKSDPGDAQLAGEYLSHHQAQLRPWLADDAPTRHLRYLVEQRERLVDQRTALVNQLQAALKLYFPQALAWLNDFTKPLAWEFLLRWPTLARAQKAQKKTLLNFFYAHHVRRGDQISDLHQRMATATPLHDDEPIIASTVLLVQALCRQLRVLACAIREHDHQIAGRYLLHPDRPIYQSLPGAGAVLEPRLLVAMGSQRERFGGAAELQSLSGIAPVTVRSGKTKVVRFRWAAPVFQRQSFHEWAALTRFWSTWAGAFYDEKIKRGFKHHAAVRALAYKWQRILYRCWQTREPYEEARYLAALRRHGSWLTACLDKGQLAQQSCEQPA